MFVHDYMKINEKGHLEISGCDAAELSSKYGTPLYLMSEERIRENMRKYREKKKMLSAQSVSTNDL